MSATSMSWQKRNRPGRLAAAVLLVQLLAAGFVPLLDAEREAAAFAQAVHIEEEGGSPLCPRSHDHHQCPTCRLVATAAAGNAHERLLDAVPATAHAQALASAERPPHTRRTSSLGSRAPPIG